METAVANPGILLDLATVSRNHLGASDSEKLYPLLYQAAIEKWSAEKLKANVREISSLKIPKAKLVLLAQGLADCVENTKR
jgi:hypothetical protein